MCFPEKVERENNKDYNQVLLDVQRSLRRFPPGELSSDSKDSDSKMRLSYPAVSTIHSSDQTQNTNYGTKVLNIKL